MTTCVPLLVSLALSPVLLMGCAATIQPTAEVPSQAAFSASAPADLPSNTTGSGHAGHHGPETSSPATATKGPSEAAKMVCGDQPKDRLQAILDLDSEPHTTSSWADSTFTCIYHLNDGALEISVREAPDKAAALTHFQAVQALAINATPIEGLANLGFPAYETPAGSAVFHKDNFVLHVDATGLPATIGPDNITPNALAYQLSTTILACWVEHH